MQKKSAFGGGTDKASRRRRYAKSNRRLSEILRRLYRGEVLSMKDLAAEFGVSLRTIQRDINERLEGFPLAKKGEQVFLDTLRSSAPDPEEIAALELLDELSRRQGHAFYARVHPLLSRLRREAANPFYAKLYMEDIGDKLHEAALLERAIRERRQIRARYRMEEESKSIDLKPLKIANFEGFWYLIALDARNDRLKKYLLRKLSHIELDEKRFAVSKELERAIERAVNVWFEPSNDPLEVRLFIDGSVARYFRLKPLAPTQRIIGEDADGSIEVLLEITHPMEIVPIIKYWLPTIRVLEPQDLDEKIRRDLRRYLEIQ